MFRREVLQKKIVKSKLKPRVALLSGFHPLINVTSCGSCRSAAATLKRVLKIVQVFSVQLCNCARLRSKNLMKMNYFTDTFKLSELLIHVAVSHTQ